MRVRPVIIRAIILLAAFLVGYGITRAIINHRNAPIQGGAVPTLVPAK